MSAHYPWLERMLRNIVFASVLGSKESHIFPMCFISQDLHHSSRNSKELLKLTTTGILYNKKEIQLHNLAYPWHLEPRQLCEPNEHRLRHRLLKYPCQRMKCHTVQPLHEGGQGLKPFKQETKNWKMKWILQMTTSV